MEPVKTPKEHHGKATAGLVLGILSLLSEILAFVPFLYAKSINPNFSQLIKNSIAQNAVVAIVVLIILGAMLGLLGLVFSIIAIKEHKGMGRTGLILSILSQLMVLAYIALIVKFALTLALA